MSDAESSAERSERAAPDEGLAAARLAVAPERRALFAGFARAFLRHLDEPRAGGDRAFSTALREFFEFGWQRAPGEVKVRVSSPDDRPGRSVIQLLQDDHPFIVDSLRMALRRQGLRERLFLHPILTVRRGAGGALTAFGAGDGSAQESAVYAEVTPRVTDPERRAEMEASLAALMRTIRVVTEDHPRMLREVQDLAREVEFVGHGVPDGRGRAARVRRFLEWLLDGNFVLMGFRSYGLRRFEDREPGYEVWLERGSGLGLWREDQSSRLLEPVRRDDLPQELRDVVDDPRLLVVDKSHLDSPIHRPGRLDRVIAMRFDESGRERGFAILHGLFTLRALRTPSSQVPLLAERLSRILAEEQLPVGSHRHRAIFAAFDSAPIEVLLHMDVDANAELVREIAASEGSKQARVVARLQRTGRAAYVAVVLPREHYAEELRGRLRQFLEARLGAAYVDDRTSFVGEGTAVLHYFCMSRSGSLALPELERFEAEIGALCARWEDRLSDALVARFGESRGGELAARYESGLGVDFRMLTDPVDAVRDVEAIERLYAGGLAEIALCFARGDAMRETTRLRIYLPEARLLSDLLPLIDHFGIRVVDAQQLRVQPPDRRGVAIDTLRVLPLGADQADLDAISDRLADALRAVICARAPDDALNGLVLNAGLDWRQVDCVRAYLEYFLQIQGALARSFVSEVLLQNPLAVRLLVQLLEARFDPALGDAEREVRVERLRAAFQGYRDRIGSLNEDRALAGIYGLIEATLRTTIFAPPSEPHRVGFKLDPSRVPDLAGAQPFREIFVHSNRMMGVHVRGGPVARGGLRWSDRRDDLRAEILELMRTQTLKNGIIVPVGAKGGFVLRGGDPSPDEARRLADEQYRVFVASLLDLTDNLDAEGRALPAAGVRALDGVDPYLVVAADKGTAHLSDAANAIALARDFWLGDAFASGGSEGYDHKKFGITARGAWECVKHHLAALGIDPERDRFTLAGIGDMSGDVFGNGLLLARRAQLLAAFDHRHVFLDPDPDPETAWAERKRLYELPRSSWADYDPAALSTGGGVHPRSAKRIALSPRVRERLAVAAEALSGAEVVRAILRMPVDLLWNGGIGTYVKAAHESHADAGDRANDPVRVDASQLRARVVGEGGNLGLTQAARIEAALAGVRLDTDAIDNSAGVDLSDHEVNYKILLAPLVRGGELSPRQRHEALFGVADEACERVLAHNRDQAMALSLDEARSKRDLAPFAHAIEHWCAAPGVDARELQVAGGEALAERAASGAGLMRPELAVLLGLAKLQTRQALAASPLIESDYLAPVYRAYFPERFRRSHPAALGGHRLRREITALEVSNRILDAGGVTLLPSLMTELGIGLAPTAAAVLLAEDVIGAPAIREAIRALAGSVSAGLVQASLLDLDRGVREVARFLVLSGANALDRARVEQWRRGLDELRAHQADILSPQERERAAERRGALVEHGLPAGVADELAALPLADRALNVLRIAEETNVPLAKLAPLYARIGEAMGINALYRALPKVDPASAWDGMTLVDLRWTLLDLQRELTARVLARRPGDPLAAVEALLAEHAAVLDGLRGLEQRALASGSAGALAVVAQRLRRLAAGSGQP
jgi:glutamate dehydrogenase